MSSTKTRVRPAGPHTLKGSPKARKSAALILEALTGVRTTQSAADSMGIALARYYVLETRALQGFIMALEPRARGRQRTSEHDIRELKAEVFALQRELRRYQALHRTAQRALGVPAEPARTASSAKTTKKKAKRRRKQSRGERILRVMQSCDVTRVPRGEAAEAASEPQTNGVAS